MPQPEAIKREIKSNPVPKGLFNKKLADIEKDKEDRRKVTINAVKNNYENNKAQRFKLEVEARPNKFEQKKQ